MVLDKLTEIIKILEEIDTSELELGEQLEIVNLKERLLLVFYRLSKEEWCMNIEDMTKLIELLGKIDVNKFSIPEQLIFVGATCEYLEKIKPILIKYAMNNEVEGGTFLFKM